MTAGSQDDEFDTMARRLERLASLKERELLDEEEYQEMRSACLAQIRGVFSSPVDVSKPAIAVNVPHQGELPYAQLHAEIVSKLGANYKNAGDDTRQRLLRSLSEMAEKQALYPGDAAHLTEIIDLVVEPTGVTDGSNNEAVLTELVRILGALTDIHTKIVGSRASSPVAKAIAETAHQSANDAAREIRKSPNPPAGAGSAFRKLWKKWALPDIEGAFEGGAAAVTVAAVFAPLSLPVAAAVGALIGGGVRSAREHGSPD